jgi:A/G-specific adenine glycosylase
VVARLFAIDTPLPEAKRPIRERQAEMTPRRRAGDYAQAMMDLGAAICTPKRPACSLCPFVDACVAHRAGSEEAFPVRVARPERPTRTGAAYVAVCGDGAVLLRHRPDRGLLGGMAEVPGSEWSSRVRDLAVPADFPVQAAWTRVNGIVIHVFTHFRLELTVFRATVPAGTAAPMGCWWAPSDTLPGEALPSVMKKAIAAALTGATRRVRSATAASGQKRAVAPRLSGRIRARLLSASRSKPATRL